MGRRQIFRSCHIELLRFSSCLGLPVIAFDRTIVQLNVTRGKRHHVGVMSRRQYGGPELRIQSFQESKELLRGHRVEVRARFIGEQ
jgi:hypothetical protein